MSVTGHPRCIAQSTRVTATGSVNHPCDDPGSVSRILQMPGRPDAKDVRSP